MAGTTISKSKCAVRAALLLTVAGSVNAVPLEFDRLPVEVHTSWMPGIVNNGGDLSCFLGAQSAVTRYSPRNPERRGPNGIQIAGTALEDTKLRAVRGYAEQGATIAAGEASFAGYIEGTGDSVILPPGHTADVTEAVTREDVLVVSGKAPRGTIVTDYYGAEGFGASYDVFNTCLKGLTGVEARFTVDTGLPQSISGEDQAYLERVAADLGARMPKPGEEPVNIRLAMPQEPEPNLETLRVCGGASLREQFADIEYAQPGDRRGQVAYTTQGFVPPDGTAQINWPAAQTLRRGEAFAEDEGPTVTLLVDGEVLTVEGATNPDHSILARNGAVYSLGTMQLSPSTQQDPSKARMQDGCAEGEKILACIVLSDKFATVSPPEACIFQLDGAAYTSPEEATNSLIRRQWREYGGPEKKLPPKPDNTVPAPGALALLGIGALGLAATRRRKPRGPQDPSL